MATYSVWMLEASNITVSNGSLSGHTQGDGSHLVGETIRLDAANWHETVIRDGGPDTDFDDNDGGQRLEGAQTIDGTTYDDHTRVEAEYRLTLRDPETGDTWEALGYNVNNSNPAYGTVEGLAFVGPSGGFPPVGRDLEVVAAHEGPGGYGQDSIAASELVTPPCFTPGTRIATPRGPVPVEHLRVGDLVETRDDGPQPLRWVGAVTLSPADLVARPEFRPVCIRADAVGPGRPARDMHVSPQHRVPVRHWRAELDYGAPEVLVAAKHLVDGERVVRSAGAGPVRYLHIMCDAHQIILADGLETETFLPGTAALAGVPADTVAEVMALFPELDRPEEIATHAARPVLKGWEGRLLARSVLGAGRATPTDQARSA